MMFPSGFSSTLPRNNRILISGGNAMHYYGRKYLYLAVAACCTIFDSPSCAADSRLSFPKQLSITQKGVNIQTGRFISSNEDLKIGPFLLRRSWGELPSFALARSFGNGFPFDSKPQWTHNYSQGSYVKTDDSQGNLVVFVVDGSEYKFRINVQYVMIPQDKSSQGVNVIQVSGGWNLTDRNGNLYIFQTHPAFSQLGMNTMPQQVLVSANYADGRQTTYTYNSAGQVRVARSNLGYALVFDYNGQGNLSTVCGFNLTVSQVDNNTSCAAASAKVSYGYVPDGSFLSSVTDSEGGVTGISYTNVGYWSFPSCITLRNSATCAISNSFGAGVLTLPDQVTGQTTATGDTWSYQYENGENPLDVPIVPGKPRWTRSTYYDGTGQAFINRYDRGLVVDASGPNGNYTYRYGQFTFTVPSTTTYGTATIDYRATTPTLVTSDAGDVFYFETNARGEITKQATLPRGTDVYSLLTVNGGKLVPDDPDLRLCCTSVAPLSIPPGSQVISQTFMPDYGAVGLYGEIWVFGCGAGPVDAKRCSKPITQVDAAGNQTDFEYSQVHGGILTETGPAPVPGGVRPQTRYSYVQRQAYVLGAGGTVVAAGPPVWLLAAKSMCKTSQWTGSACSAPNDEVRTTYEYGPSSGLNNLNLRGEVVDASGLALRTCYAYDWRGLRTSVTTPRAGLGVCP